MVPISLSIYCSRLKTVAFNLNVVFVQSLNGWPHHWWYHSWLWYCFFHGDSVELASVPHIRTFLAHSL